MKIYCEHGFYTFAPEHQDDQAYFEAQTGFKLVRLGERLTFSPLTQLGDLCLQGQPYGNLTGKVTCCGTPSDIMRANGWTFDLKAQALVELSALTQLQALYLQLNGAILALETLPQAGAPCGAFGRLLSFAGVARFDSRQFILRTYEFQDQSN